MVRQGAVCPTALSTGNIEYYSLLGSVEPESCGVPMAGIPLVLSTLTTVQPLRPVQGLVLFDLLCNQSPCRRPGNSGGPSPGGPPVMKPFVASARQRGIAFVALLPGRQPASQAPARQPATQAARQPPSHPASSQLGWLLYYQYCTRTAGTGAVGSSYMWLEVHRAN